MWSYIPVTTFQNQCPISFHEQTCDCRQWRLQLNVLLEKLAVQERINTNQCIAWGKKKKKNSPKVSWCTCTISVNPPECGVNIKNGLPQTAYICDQIKSLLPLLWRSVTCWWVGGNIPFTQKGSTPPPLFTRRFVGNIVGDIAYKPLLYSRRGQELNKDRGGCKVA